MSTDTRKILIIEAVLKTEDEKFLTEVEKIIEHSKEKKSKISAFDFVGTISKEDAALMNQAIEEGCEQIHPADWK